MLSSYLFIVGIMNMREFEKDLLWRLRCKGCMDAPEHGPCASFVHYSSAYSFVAAPTNPPIDSWLVDKSLPSPSCEHPPTDFAPPSPQSTSFNCKHHQNERFLCSNVLSCWWSILHPLTWQWRVTYQHSSLLTNCSPFESVPGTSGQMQHTRLLDVRTCDVWCGDQSAVPDNWCSILMQ